MLPKASIAHIAVGLPVEGPFDYLIPDKLQERIALGDRVVVNFAHAKRLGFVVGLANDSAFKELKGVEAVLDAKPLLSEASLRCAREMVCHYGCSLGEAIEVMLPLEARKPKAVICHPVDKKTAPRSPQNAVVHSQSVTAHWPLIAERIGKTLQAGEGVIVLVPDSSQIPFVTRQLKSVLPANAVIHNNERTHKQELENWAALREGKARVVIGLRTAVFAPVPALGLMVIYDEDNASYQEEQTPFYHVRDVALMRSSIEGCDAVFTGPSPSAELMFLAKERGFKVIPVAPEQAVYKQLIDMTNFTSKGPMTISYPLRNSLEKILLDGGKSLVFINRRGFNTFTRCLFCGHVLRCQRCESNLVYSSAKKKFECRRCGTLKDPLKACPKCGKEYLRSQGVGVERVVSDLKRIFPLARVEGFDKETAVFPRKCDILVSTQAVFRMLGEVSFDSVGVLEIDAEFSRGDYRSGQHAFSLLAHLALLAKRRFEIQTFHIDNAVLRDFAAGRAAEFYDHELKLRQDLKFPPYYHLVKITCRGIQEKVVSGQAELLYNLMAENKVSGIDLLSLQPDVITKLRDKYRYIILVRGEDRGAVLKFVKESLAKMRKKSGVIVTVQVES
jgi:primosomal protein N' (replication factor Y)